MMSKRRLQMQKRKPDDPPVDVTPEQLAELTAFHERLDRANLYQAERQMLLQHAAPDSKRFKTGNGTPMYKDQPRLNQYTCELCGGVITTVDRDPGTTPMFLNCRATPGCTGRMVSSMYRVPSGLEPTHEWYKPDKLPRDPGMRDHVQRGGLLIRKIVPED